ncbi:hypothetical protein D3C81_1566360 [compost metagenome]
MQAHLVGVQLDQRFAGDVGETDAVALQQRMLGRQPEAVRRVGQHLGLQGVAVLQVGQDQHADVDFAGHQQVLYIRTLILHHARLHVGVGALEAGDQVGQVIAGDQAGHADGQAAGNLVGALLQAALGVLHGGQDQMRLAQELVALVGQGHALGVAVEQAHADFLFQLLDGQGQGRLRDEHRLRGGGDRAGLGHGDEVTDLAEGHHRRGGSYSGISWSL